MKLSEPWANCLGLLLLGCANPTSGAAQELPANAYLAKGDEVGQLFHQCSRAVPAFAPTAYIPTPGDVIRLEQHLPLALATALADRYGGSERVTFDPARYVRHYAAYEAGGRAMIYGNFVPRDADIERRLGPGTLSIVCDGGPAFFGVEYDVERRQITRVSFNGAI